MANIENIKKWIAALRSGEFGQGTGALHAAGQDGKPDTYCCLGVGVVVAMANGCTLKRKPEPIISSYHYYDEDPRLGVSGILPRSVCEWLGLEGRDVNEGSVIFHAEADAGRGEARDAISANDTLKWTFDQIADKLEQHFGLKEELANA